MKALSHMETPWWSQSQGWRNGTFTTALRPLIQLCLNPTGLFCCLPIIYVCAYIHMSTHTQDTVHISGSEDNLWESILSFHPLGPRDHTQVVGLGSKHLHLQGSGFSLLKPEEPCPGLPSKGYIRPWTVKYLVGSTPPKWKSLLLIFYDFIFHAQIQICFHF